MRLNFFINIMSEVMERQRVVIPVSYVTSYGGIEALWDNLLAGKSGIDSVKSFDTTDYPSKVGSECLHFDAAQYMDPKEARRNDRYRFAVVASRLALKDAVSRISILRADRRCSHRFRYWWYAHDPTKAASSTKEGLAAFLHLRFPAHC